jgi:hypothetical protein
MNLESLSNTGSTPLLHLPREMQMSRNTLSAWLAERGTPNLTVRTLQKIETWCATQEAAGAHGGPKGAR